jgi:hypothetical protein
MNTYKFYIIDDKELYHWDAVTIEQARKEICDEFEIEMSDIEAIALEAAE